MTPRVALLLLATGAALTACAPRSEPFFQPRPGAPDTNPATVAACREQSLRVISRQDRSQLIREDERDSRLGSESTPYSLRTQTDRLGREFQFERMVNECVRQNTRPAASTPAPTSGPAPRS